MHKTIDNYLNGIIKESLRSTLQRRALQEKEVQASLDKESPKSQPNEKDKLKKGDVSLSDIVEKLNTIRSGKSFKDSLISSSLEKYVNDLTDVEKTALFAFLKGISQIVTGEIEPEEAIDPSGKIAGIEMKKSEKEKTVTVKPTVVKGGNVEKKKTEKKPKEDTSGPVPITPKTKK